MNIQNVKSGMRFTDYDEEDCRSIRGRASRRVVFWEVFSSDKFVEVEGEVSTEMEMSVFKSK